MLKESLLFVLLFSFTQADTVQFKNGAVLNGKVSKQDDTTLTIDVAGVKTTYSKLDIQNTTIDTVVSPPPPSSCTNAYKQHFTFCSIGNESECCCHIAYK